MHGSTTGITEISVPAPPPLHTGRITAHTYRKCLRSLISRRVRWQNMAWSNGVMRLMATLVPDAMCTAEL